MKIVRRRPLALEASVRIGLLAVTFVAAFAAGHSTASRAPQPLDDPAAGPALLRDGVDRAGRSVAAAVGLDVYSEAGRPVGRLTALLHGEGHDGLARIAVAERGEEGAREIVVPLGRLVWRDDRVVLADGAALHWLI